MAIETKSRYSPILVLLLLCLSLLALTLPQKAMAAPEVEGLREACVIDEIHILTNAEMMRLDAKLKKIEDAHHIRILAATVKDWKDKPLEPLGQQILASDLAVGGDNGAILLLLAPENRDYYLIADGKMRTRITDEGFQHLTERLLPALIEIRYADAFHAYAATVDEMLTYYEREQRPFTTVAPLSAVAGLITRGEAQAKDAAPIGAVRVMDEADLLTDAEEQELDASIAAFEKTHGVRILVGNIKDTHGQVLGEIANAVVDRIADGGANGTIVFLLAPKDRNFYISTDNKMRQRITDEYGIEHLADSFVPDLKDNQYGKAYTAFAATVDEMLTYYEKEGKAYIPLDPWAIVGILGTALLLAAIVHGSIASYLEEGMDTTAHAAEADDYLSYTSVRITHSKDIHIRTSEHRRAKYEKKTSSSGSHITTSSSDSSHGGGGGKY